MLSEETNSGLRPNQVSETSLYGVPIVSLVIDGKERLCLAQISNTLLKNYSYNEIHNRRVALGITCVQCTPVQLELLRRAGAMPISSRRCGMITKREAERLCKSFLGEHSPPKLPENFAFDVSHDCAWGCRGSFIPARYNSSRAKCIKCSLCSMYFSPNKFIFHSHRSPEARYLQPDAANFNSWRRHLRLTEKKAADDISHAWEDVKAMFNGGSRKRTLPRPHEGTGLARCGAEARRTLKSLRCEDESGPARSYPVIPVPVKASACSCRSSRPRCSPLRTPSPATACALRRATSPKPCPGCCGRALRSCTRPSRCSGPGPGAARAAIPGLPTQASCGAGGASGPGGAHRPKPPEPPLNIGPVHEERCSSAHSSCTRTDDERSGDESVQRKMSYVSAFRPVVRDAESIAKLYGARSGHLSPTSSAKAPA
uniref:SKI family transcriptional corepressor 1 n=1 Tax=Neogobius melanostomus TaxID=47308 RepID=A0A8C6UUY2_9GOBI